MVYFLSWLPVILKRMAKLLYGKPFFFLVGFSVINEDVAIGAPSEQNGLSKGAVYIYLGSKDGLANKPAQKIVPSDITSQVVNGFGYSMGYWWDIDDNGKKR